MLAGLLRHLPMGRAPRPRSDVRPKLADVRPGMVLNRTYRILHPLASGGVGRVFVAAHTRLPGKVAVKVLHGSFLRDRDSLARFRNEAEILAGLQHPNVVRVLDYNVSEGGVPYLVMELLGGVELRDRIGQARGRRSPAWVAGIVRQVAGALRSAHLKGIVHRDIKPENIMVLSVDGETDVVKVLDFGVSNVSGQRRSRRRRVRDDDVIVGTPGYMPPEQLQLGGKPVDDRADQFSLAAVAWELLAGRPAFLAEDEGALLWQLLNDEPPPLARFCDLPPGQLAAVEKVLKRALSKDRNERYPDILEFARALETALLSDHSGAAEGMAAAAQGPSTPSAPVSTPSLPVLPALAAPLDEFPDVGHSYLW
jgi:serine/threonine-protein kinase